MSEVTRRSLFRGASALGFLGGIGAVGSVFASDRQIAPDSKSVLIVVDVQRCFIDGTLATKGSEEVIPVINRIAPAFKNIVVAQDWHPAGHASFASTHAGHKPFGSIKLSYGTQVLWPDHCVQGTDDAALHPDLKVPSAQLIIRKGYNKGVDSYSAFEEADHKTATGLAGYLKQRGINTVFVTGLATDFCVAWTAMDARKAGFRAYVIEDATRSINLDGSLEKAWKQMSARGVRRIQSTDLALS